MLQSAVIDNASLIYLSHLHREKAFFHYLRNLFNTVYVPLEVKNEFVRGAVKEPDRYWIIQRLNPDQGFYRLCTSYDSFVMITVENYKGIDKGEAEAYAQLKKVNAQIIISDDKAFIVALKQLDSGIRVYTTLHLISWLEHAKLLPDWKEMIQAVYLLRPFKSSELRQAYTQLAERLGLNISKKEVSAKCSLSKIIKLK